MIRSVVAAISVTCGSGCGRIAFDEATDAGGATARANYAFVTSGLRTGSLGGVAGADAVCVDTAATAGLDGTYVAWIAGASYDRLTASRGWTRVDGTPIADRATDFLTGGLLYPIDLDELGREPATPSSVWTGLHGDGRTEFDCLGWTNDVVTSVGIAGDLRAGGTRFTDNQPITCDQLAHLLCLEVGRVTPMQLSKARGRLAFVSSELWAPAGRPAADAVCQSEAKQANLPGTYLAALPTTTSPTATRFDLAGPPWIRVDGVPLARTARDLFMADAVETFVNRRADGVPGPRGTWWAGDPLVTPGLSQTCQDWTAQVGSGPVVGFPDATDRASMFFAGGDYCENPRHLLCLQQ